MKDTVITEKSNGEPCDYYGDFNALSANEKREVLKTAKKYRQLLAENGLISLPCNEGDLITAG